ncbi:MAG: VWA domain-containing protein [Planctomycetaceae bacterium]|nr:VWA domain-containing protein [Planctomycetaceae bacterium]
MSRNQFPIRIKIPSWIGSILFHFCVLLFLLFCLRLFPEPPTTPGDRLASGGIVLKKDSGDRKIYVDSKNNEFDENSPNIAENTATAPILETMLDGNLSETDLSRNLPETIGLHSASQQSVNIFSALNSGNTKIGGDKFPALSNGKGGQKTLRIFGTEGTGNSFVFVFDRSGSMSEHAERPIRAAKTELIQCIDSLENLYRFNIIFYNESYLSWKQHRAMTEATDQNKESAKRFVEGIIPVGGTRHLEPLLEAVKHRPDVIFFLTDGDEAHALSAGQLDKIAHNNSHRSQINVIQFGVGANRKSNFLQKLAANNRGQYSYINVIELR